MKPPTFADTWQSNDWVTNKLHPEETGRVVVIHRLTDCQRFTKIRLESGEKVWANDDFVLGVGLHLHRCLECEQPYRGDTFDRGFCPACERSQRPNAPSDPLPASRLWRHDQDRRHR